MASPFKKLSLEERRAEHMRVRERGVWRFIFVRGILGYGAFAFLFDFGWNLIFEHRHVDLGFLLGKTLQWIAAGVFFGWFMWRIEYDADEEEGRP